LIGFADLNWDLLSLTRFYTKNTGDYVIEEYGSGYIRKADGKNFGSLSNFKREKVSRIYLCNEGSSDLGTFSYFFKINGEYIVKLWFENGDLDDLDDVHREELKNFIELIEEIGVARRKE
jgi:hypothetical protein